MGQAELVGKLLHKVAVGLESLLPGAKLVDLLLPGADILLKPGFLFLIACELGSFWQKGEKNPGQREADSGQRGNLVQLAQIGLNAHNEGDYIATVPPGQTGNMTGRIAPAEIQLHRTSVEIVSGAMYAPGMKLAERPGWDEYFMDIAHVVARRGNCLRRRVAAVIVRDQRIVSTGYNGTPRGIRNCSEGGCARCASDAPSGHSLGECICCHAEENAIVQAAYHGISVKGGSLYCTTSPCLMCTKMIINAGLAEVVYENEYRFSDQARALFKEAGVICRRFERKGAA